MVELQILNKLLMEKSLSFVINNGITSDYFVTYKAEYEFIENHYKNYGIVPDELTMADNFKDFDFVDTNESEQYLYDKISEQYVFTAVSPMIQKSADMLLENSKEAVMYLMKAVAPLMKVGMASKGKNIMKLAGERWDEYIRRNSLGGLLGISTGLKELDELLHGWLPGEEVVTILGRTNEGKSWILLYFLIMAWLQGKKILLYSGEMSALIVGYRTDTLAGHFSNMAIMTGKDDLGGVQGHISPDEYKSFLDNLANSENPFIVVTPDDFGGKKPTVSQINMLIELHDPDLIGIDQISLMEDERASKGEQTRLRLTHISEDLFISSTKYGKPFLVDAQANRVSADKKKKKDTGNEEVPELAEIGESDGIGQNSSRVISIKQTSAGLKIAVKKNRYGINNREFLYFWDIDTGRFQFIHTADYREQVNGTVVDNEDENVEIF